MMICRHNQTAIIVRKAFQPAIGGIDFTAIGANVPVNPTGGPPTMLSHWIANKPP
jgi:hypothetical protein